MEKTQNAQIRPAPAAQTRYVCEVCKVASSDAGNFKNYKKAGDRAPRSVSDIRIVCLKCIHALKPHCVELGIERDDPLASTLARLAEWERQRVADEAARAAAVAKYVSAATDRRPMKAAIGEAANGRADPDTARVRAEREEVRRQADAMLREAWEEARALAAGNCQPTGRRPVEG